MNEVGGNVEMESSAEMEPALHSMEMCKDPSRSDIFIVTFNQPYNSIPPAQCGNCRKILSHSFVTAWRIREQNCNPQRTFHRPTHGILPLAVTTTKRAFFGFLNVQKRGEFAGKKIPSYICV